MHDTQYALFQELDRRCVARGFQDSDCEESARLKRESIDQKAGRKNPVACEVLAGKTTLVAEYDRFSRMFRGVRRFLPMPHDEALNERLRQLAKIVPNVKHFTRRSLFAIDNPVTAGIYGFIASVALDLVISLTLRTEMDETTEAIRRGWSGGWLAVGFTVLGVLVGTFAMMRYRTRDRGQIHAREAAAYMDANYALYLGRDERAWADYVRRQAGKASARITLASSDQRA